MTSLAEQVEEEQRQTRKSCPVMCFEWEEKGLGLIQHEVKAVCLEPFWECKNIEPKEPAVGKVQMKDHHPKMYQSGFRRCSERLATISL